MRNNFRSTFVTVVFLVGCGGGASGVTVNAMPQGGNWTGVYFSPQYGEMQLVQNGSAVTGRYVKDERKGRFEGESNGDVLEFEWIENKHMVSNRATKTRGRGYFRYIVDPSNGEHLLKGRWGLGDDATNGGEWNAYKSKTREVDMFDSDASRSDDDEEFENDDSLETDDDDDF